MGTRAMAARSSPVPETEETSNAVEMVDVTIMVFASANLDGTVPLARNVDALRLSLVWNALALVYA